MTTQPERVVVIHDQAFLWANGHAFDVIRSAVDAAAIPELTSTTLVAAIADALTDTPAGIRPVDAAAALALAVAFVAGALVHTMPDAVRVALTEALGDDSPELAARATENGRLAATAVLDHFERNALKLRAENRPGQ